MLAKLSKDDSDKYRTFWSEFGSVLKEGLAEDNANQSKIAGLLRFNSTHSAELDQDRSLGDYIESAAEDQEHIYYLLAESASAGRASPHLEAFSERDIEVLLLSDRLDEWAMQYLPEFEGKSFKDIGRGEVDLGGSGDSKPLEPDLDKDQKHFLKRVKRGLRDRVDEVRSSSRLRESAACIVLKEQDVGYQMQELLKATGQEVQSQPPILEINLSHPLILRMQQEQNDQKFDRYSALILDQATLAEGRQLDNPAAFVQELNTLLLELGAPAQDGS